MIPLKNPPELWDGGYWTEVPVMPPEDDPNARSVDVPGDWSALYDGGKALVRTVTPVNMAPETPVSLSGKFRSRVGGR